MDTNTLVSRMLLAGGVAGRAVDKAVAEGVQLVSDDTMVELTDVLAMPRFDRYVPLDDRRQFIRLLGGLVRIVPILHRVAACRDPKDDMLLHVALNGEADVLVTGDCDLLVLHEGFRRSHGCRSWHRLSICGAERHPRSSGLRRVQLEARSERAPVRTRFVQVTVQSSPETAHTLRIVYPPLVTVRHPVVASFRRRTRLCDALGRRLRGYGAWSRGGFRVSASSN